MFNKDLTEEYKNKKMPDDIKSNILENMHNAKPPVKYSFSNLSIKRRILIYAAVFVSLIVVVSAAAIVYNNTQYIPFRGFVEGDYEIYATPEILPLGSATIETVMRAKNSESSELSIIILNMYEENIKIVTEDYGEFDAAPITIYGSRSNNGYYIKDFPEINEFTIVNGNNSTEVKLELNDFQNVTVLDDFGVNLKYHNISKSSKILAFDIIENNFDIEKILGVPDVAPRQIELSSGNGYYLTENEAFKTAFINEFRLYNADGNEYPSQDFIASTMPSGLGSLIFFDKKPEEPIGKVIIDSILVRIECFSANIYADEYIPIPDDGEKIIFDDGLIIFNHNGLICTVYSVSRQKDEISVVSLTEYNGENSENISDIYINIKWSKDWRGSGGGVWIDEKRFEENSFEIDKDETQIKMKMTGLHYTVNGNWEINFN